MSSMQRRSVVAKFRMVVLFFASHKRQSTFKFILDTTELLSNKSLEALDIDGDIGFH